MIWWWVAGSALRDASGAAVALRAPALPAAAVPARLVLWVHAENFQRLSFMCRYFQAVARKIFRAKTKQGNFNRTINNK